MAGARPETLSSRAKRGTFRDADQRSLASLGMTPSIDNDDPTLTPEPLPAALVAAYHDELRALLARVTGRTRHRDPRRVIPARRTAFRLAGQRDFTFRREPVARGCLYDEAAARRQQ